MREWDYWEFSSTARTPPEGFLRKVLHRIAKWFAIVAASVFLAAAFILPAMRRVYWGCASGCDFETRFRLRARWHEIWTYLRSRRQNGHIMLHIVEDVTP